MKKIILFVAIQLSISLQIFSQTIEEGRLYIYGGQFDKARTILKNVKINQPKKTDVYFYIGETYYKNGQIDSALYWYNEGVKFDEKQPLSYVGLGKVVRKDDPGKSDSYFEQAKSLSKRHAEVEALIAEYYIYDFPVADKAVALAQNSVTKNTKDFYSKLILAEAHLLRKEADLAIKLINDAENLDTNNVLTNYYKGLIYYRAQSYNASLELLEKGISKNPEFALLYKQISEIYFVYEKYPMAVKYLKEYQNRVTPNKEEKLRLASLLFLGNNYDEAINLINSLPNNNEFNPTATRILAFAYYNKKDYQKANEYISKLFNTLKGEELIASDYEYNGKILIELGGKDSLAVENIKKSLSIDSTKLELYDFLATTFYNKRNFPLATELFQLKIDKTHSKTNDNYTKSNDYFQKGVSHYFIKEYALADSCFKKVISFNKESQYGYIWSARCCYYLDPGSKNGLAKPMYEKYIAIVTKLDNPNKNELLEAYQYLGTYHTLVSKQNEDANKYWDKVLELEPNNPKALEFKKTLAQ